MNKYLVFSLLIITFTLGMGAGYTLTPEYAKEMQAKYSPMKELGLPDKFLDLRYLDGVIAHHRAAIYMAKQALENSHRTEVRKLSEAIIKADEESIKELYSWKQSWFKDTRQIVSFSKTNLGPDDDKFDLRYLNALIAHHDEAILTAKEVMTKSSRLEVLNLSDGIISGLSANKNQLIDWRKSWYQI